MNEEKEMGAAEGFDILVVDDEEVIREFLRRYLTLHGAAVDTASSGPQAIEKAGQRRYSLFFLDVRMPQMDGLETLRELRKLHQDAACVMMTGYAVDDILQQARAEGVLMAIKKPFDLKDLENIFEKLKEGMKGS